MSKTTMGTKLPRKLVDKMEVVGGHHFTRGERCSDCRHRHQPYNCLEYSFK